MNHEVLHLFPANPPAHEALPARGTLKRASDGAQLDPPMPWDYPIIAECAHCGKSIGRQESLFADWVHLE
jgi:hypothetical protein